MVRKMVLLVQQCWVAVEGGVYSKDDEHGSPGAVVLGCR
jgi:hypothetical protein